MAPIKASRLRNQPVRIVWHDTPGAELLGEGLAVAEQRGRWRLERVLPNGGPWPPGAPTPVIAEAERPELLDPPPPAAMMPVAAFEGRALAVELRRGEEVVSVRLLEGAMRGVAAGRRAARVQLVGADGAALDLALDLADDVALTVPRAVLAREAIAAARSDEPPPRRLGAPCLSPELSVAAGFAHATGHLTDVMLHWGAEIAGGGTALEPVHQMRVAMRRLRSLMGQFPAGDEAPLLHATKLGLRSLGAVLGPARDWDVFVSETGRSVQGAFAPEAGIVKLMAAAGRRRAEHYGELRALLGGPEHRKLMIRLAGLSRPCCWEALADPTRPSLNLRLSDFSGLALSKRLKRLLHAGDTIEHLEAASLHDIRLLGKRLRYAAELFAPLYQGKKSRRFIRRLAALQEAIGVLNDGAVATRLMAELAGNGAERAAAIGMVRGFVAGRGAAERHGIARAWKRFRQADPFWS